MGSQEVTLFFLFGNPCRVINRELDGGDIHVVPNVEYVLEKPPEYLLTRGKKKEAETTMQ